MRCQNICTLVAFVLLATAATGQRLRLDASGAFFSHVAAGSSGTSTTEVVRETKAGPITPDMLARYASDRQGPRMLENLAFAMALARECESLGLLRSAPTLARSTAAQQRGAIEALAPRTRARIATEALRDLRIAALVGAERATDDQALRERFEHLYGKDGVRVVVRHVLCTDRLSAPKTAMERAQALRQRLQNGAEFAALLAQSHDRATRRMLRNADKRAHAGELPNYNYHRYGDTFAAAVRTLKAGEVSQPVASSVGVHLIQVRERTVTRLEDVAPALRQQLASGKARSSEILRLRERLLQKYGIRKRADVAARQRTPVPDLGPPAKTAWPHYRGNPQLHGTSAGRVGSKPTLAWTFATNGEILSSPVIQNGTVFVGSTDNSVYAIDLATGKQRWAFATKDMVEAPPLWLDGRIYIGSSDFFFYALDAASGKLLWKFETQDRILGGANWFRGKNGKTRILVGSYDANVYCFDSQGGDPLWTYTTDNYVNGSPAIAGNEAIFGGCDAGLHLVNLETGERVAKVELGEGCQVAGSVALAGDQAYFGHYGNEFLRVDLDSGDTRWRYRSKRQGFCSSPAINSDYVVFGGRDRHLHCAARKDGKPLWKFRTRRKVDASPVICGNNRVCFGSGDGRLYLLRLSDGKLLWKYDVGKPIYSSPAVIDGMIVVGAGDKRVYAFAAPVGAGNK